ncbi:hypothetical protein C8P68_101897 [Mucilaginibacter yixingensis]|uniref:Phosphate-selective porin O/P n=1 Tax=Mucilaginibacter yixingensis TaxID=1295612 RepID=A0A2T5JGW4_9SPHI|nr:hypothetical protein [Mucilaginibacter yixingensis]PTR01659.1 hypothetical protein C8P68_101897 [Mucilaginibacter yixingensis]
MFTKLFSAFAPVCLMIVSASAQTVPASAGSPKATLKKDSVIVRVAETKKTEPQASADTTWKPLRRLWGYGFGDLYYDAHADKTNRGPENNYNGVPAYRNAFQFRRLYLGYDYDITPKYRAEVLLASEPSANTGTNGTTAIQNGDNLVDNKMAFWIKNFNLRVRDLWTGTDLVIGEMGTPSFTLNEPAVKDLPGSATNAPTTLSEATWGYRSIEKTITDFHKNNSFDLGLALQGSFNPATKTLGYVVMVGNSSQANLLSATNDNTGFYKIVYGDLWGKFFNKHLLIDFYADYLKTAGSTATIPEQSHNMFKLFVAYVSPVFSGGVEAYTQRLTNGVTDTTTKRVTNATVNGLSVWVRGSIIKGRLGYFARWDGYNPFTNYIRTDTYTMNTNYGSYNPNYKEKFITAGLDFTTAGNIHFMPNIWYLGFKDQKYATTAGYVGNDHILVFRSTVYFAFGK